MTQGLVVGVVPGVAPDRWVRAWRERRREPLTVVPLDDAQAGPALGAAVVMAFARIPLVGVDPDDLHVIPLWEETPVVVAAKDSPIRAFDVLALADLEGEERRTDLDVVAAGHGIAVMPQSVFRATGRRDLVGRPLTDAAPTRIGLAWRRADGGELVDAFIGIVRGRTANSSR